MLLTWAGTGAHTPIKRSQAAVLRNLGDRRADKEK